MTNDENTVVARRARARVGVAELDHDEWGRARPVRLAHYWSGAPAPAARQAEARLLWDEEGLCARFLCEQGEPFVVAGASAQRERKTIGLWERDVCEMFVAPRADDPVRYFEFEVAPTGEWLDLALRMTAAGRETDWDFHSGMTAAARILDNSFAVAMRVPWGAFDVPAAPRAGALWRANLFRCVGAGETRGYVAWRPTHTPEPGFHVPEKFGWLRFDV
jgi:hypothetical protein